MSTHFIFSAVLVLVATLGASCANRKSNAVSLDVSVNNATTTTYWVNLDWNAVPVGILPSGGSATAVAVAPPTLDVLTLDMMVDTNRQHHANIKTDISALRRLSPGHHDVTISIVSETAAKVLIDGQEK